MEETKFFMGVAIGRLLSAGFSKDEIRREVEQCFRALDALDGTPESAAFDTAFSGVLPILETVATGAGK